MNETWHSGNLTRDPESKVMTNGKTRTVFTIAVNRDYVNQEGKREADFITYVCYEKTAENVAKYLSKGRKANVRGHVRTGHYEKEGKTIFTTEFIADKVEFLSSPQDRGQDSTGAAAPTQAAPAPQTSGGGFVQVDSDELPF